MEKIDHVLSELALLREDVRQLTEKVSHLEEDVTYLKEGFDYLRAKIDILWPFGDMVTAMKYAPVATSKSPLTLSDIGTRVLDHYKGKEAIDLHEDFLIEEIEKRNFKTPLDVHLFSERLVASLFLDQHFNAVKNKIFTNPEWENQAVTVKTLIVVMALYLRDKYFKKHPDVLSLAA